MVQTPSVLQRFRDDVAREVARLMPAGDEPLYAAVRHQLGWSEGGLPQLGKCLRPTLCLIGCEAAGGDPGSALPAAAAIELLHNFSLIHDDIEDGDEMRHHRPTVWAAFGKGRAALAGLALWAIALKGFAGLVERGVPPERALAARRLVSDACNEMISGQHLDLTYEGRPRVSLREYTEMISLKTAALIAAALQAGAVLGGAPEDEVHRLGEFGRNLGLAFQIRDDILGIWGEGSATGKPVGADIARRKKSLPVVHALEHVVEPDRTTLRRLYARPHLDEADVAEVLDILQRWNVRYFVQGLAEDYGARAMSALAQTEVTAAARRDLDELMGFILRRDF
jgi:geranylgeranyl diphosphate synthase type I